MISGKPVKSSIAPDVEPGVARAPCAVPPVETISTPSSARPRAKSTMPRLSETDSSARRTRTSPGCRDVRLPAMAPSIVKAPAGKTRDMTSAGPRRGVVRSADQLEEDLGASRGQLDDARPLRTPRTTGAPERRRRRRTRRTGADDAGATRPSARAEHAPRRSQAELRSARAARRRAPRTERVAASQLRRRGSRQPLLGARRRRSDAATAEQRGRPGPPARPPRSRDQTATGHLRLRAGPRRPDNASSRGSCARRPIAVHDDDVARRRS